MIIGGLRVAQSMLAVHVVEFGGNAANANLKFRRPARTCSKQLMTAKNMIKTSGIGLFLMTFVISHAGFCIQS